MNQLPAIRRTTKLILMDRFSEDNIRAVDVPAGASITDALTVLHEKFPVLFTSQAEDQPLPAFPNGVRFKLPTAVIGTNDNVADIIEQARWGSYLLEEEKPLVLMTMPLGGGGRGSTGKQVAGIIAALALTVVAPYAGPAIATALSLGTFAGHLITGAILAGGAYFLGRVAMKEVANTPTEPDQVYTATASSNRYNPLGVVPVLYGRLRYPPFFATTPYSEYVDNDHYLYQVFCVTAGHADIHKIFFGETEVWDSSTGYSDSFEDITFEFISPDSTEITLFPAGVITSSSVGTQEIPDPPSILGPFPVNAAGENNRINRIAVDIVFSRGLNLTDDRGRIQPAAADIKADYRAIDDSGNPIGSWIPFVTGAGQDGAERFWGATRQPLRFTRFADVSDGRYEVRMYATFPPFPVDSEISNRSVWAGLKGYLVGFTVPTYTTLIAARIRANDDFNGFSANELFVEATRKLPTYDAVEEVWTTPVATRSIAWAAADILRNQYYGGQRSDNAYNLDWLTAYAPFWQDREDFFDAIFDRPWTLLAALTATLRCGRAHYVRVGGVIDFVRDEARDIKRAVFTPDNIVAGSLSRELIFFEPETPDSAYVQFLNADTWRMEEVLAYIPAIGNTKAINLDLFGITNRDHAWREGVTEVAANAYRNRERIVFTGDLEGKLLVRLDPILVDHPLITGLGEAQVLSKNGLVLTLDGNVANPLTRQFFTRDGDGWTSSNAGDPLTVSSLPGPFVNDGIFNTRCVQRIGTSSTSIRTRAVITPPIDDAIIELQVRWRVVGAGQGRIIARCASLDGDYAFISISGPTLNYVGSGAGIITSKFYFATSEIASSSSDITAWSNSAQYLRFGVNVNGDEEGSTVNIEQIRIRKVFDLQDQVYIRGKDGKEWGPCVVDVVRYDDVIVLNNASLQDLEETTTLDSIWPDDRSEPPHLILYQEGRRPFDGLLLEAVPQGDDKFLITVVKDAPEVYSADETSTPPPYLPKPKPPAPPERPVIDEATLWGYITVGTGNQFELQAGWRAAAGAKRYRAMVSYDEGVSWVPVYRGVATTFSSVVSVQTLILRAQAIGKYPGPWVQFIVGSVYLPPVEPPPGTKPPTKPTSIRTLAGLGLIELNWIDPVDPAENLHRINIYVNDVNNSETAQLQGSMPKGAQAFVVSPLEHSTNYFFWLESVNIYGQTSDKTNTIKARTLDWPFGNPDDVPPGPVSNVTFEAGYKLIALYWDNPVDADLADIEVWVSPNNNLNNAVLGGTARAPTGDGVTVTSSSAVVSDLANNTTYWFWTRTIDYWTNYGTFEAAGSATTLAGVADIANNTVTADQIMDLSILTNKLANLAVALDKVANNAINNLKVVDLAILSNKLADAAVELNKLANNAVTETKITNNAISTPKVLANAIVALHIVASGITTEKLFANAVTAAKIAANSIVSNHIIANGILAVHLAAGSVIAEKIGANAVTAIHIAAKSIIASSLVITDLTNILKNPYFEDADGNASADGWTIASSNISVNSLTQMPVKWGLRFIGQSAYQSARAGLVTAKPGEQFALSIEFRRTSSPASNGTLWVRMLTYDKDKNIISGQGTVALIASAANYTADTNHLERTVVTASNHSNLAYIELTIETFDDHTQGHWWVWRPILRRASNAEMIVDGNILTNKLAAEAVTAEKIAANTITGNQISANSVHGNRITANTITATQIAANTIIGNNIAANAITANKLAANSVTANQLAANSVYANAIQANTINSTHIRANTIWGNRILANSIEGSRISANTITANKLSVTTLNAISADLGVVTAGTIRDASNNFRIELNNSRLIIADAS